MFPKKSKDVPIDGYRVDMCDGLLEKIPMELALYTNGYRIHLWLLITITTFPLEPHDRFEKLGFDGCWCPTLHARFHSIGLEHNEH